MPLPRRVFSTHAHTHTHITQEYEGQKGREDTQKVQLPYCYAVVVVLQPCVSNVLTQHSGREEANIELTTTSIRTCSIDSGIKDDREEGGPIRSTS